MPSNARRRRHGVGDVRVLLIVLAVALFGAGVIALVAAVQRTGARADRAMCASQLKAIGMSMLLYANENRGRLPRTMYTPGETVKPVWGTGMGVSDPFAPDGPTNDVSAVLFLLLRTQDITSEIFTCPASRATKDTYGGGTNSAVGQSNFTDVRRNLSYSIQNPYPSDGVVPATDQTWWTSTMPAGFALAADMNPGTAGDKDDVLRPTLNAPSGDMRWANSNNHGGDGQNVLFADGRVDYVRNPFVGIEHDHIFANKRGEVAASPVDATDSVLLPTDD